jgi:metallo-beta-lactamase family protein
MIESTYGDRLHPAVEAIQNHLEDIVKRVVERGGRIIVPAFAVGRTQEIVYDLHQLCYTGRIPDLSIYVDSPLALNVTEVFRLHADCYDAETRSFILDSGEQDPFGFYRLEYVRSVAESKRLNVTPNPIIIISASGMAEAGRVQHHLKQAIVDPRNAVLITGWQAPHTLGRRIAEKQEHVRIYGESYPLRAEVHTLYGYSAHADRNDLLNWSSPRASTVQTAFVVHGAPEQSQALASGMQENGYQSVIVPKIGDIVNL